MTWWRERSEWLLPTVTTLLVAALGVITNVATDLHSNWIAWLVVVLLVVAVAAATAASERKRRKPEGGGTVVDDVSGDNHASRVYGLQMRRVRTINPNGSIRIETEFFSEELARQSLGDDLLDESDA